MKANLLIEVSNHGTADQIHDDIELHLSNVQFTVQENISGTKYKKNELLRNFKES